jgi:hypothetical protein
MLMGPAKAAETAASDAIAIKERFVNMENPIARHCATSF